MCNSEREHTLKHREQEIIGVLTGFVSSRNPVRIPCGSLRYSGADPHWKTREFYLSVPTFPVLGERVKVDEV
jgi:hypothetical protein